jgi:hypothetical protein
MTRTVLSSLLVLALPLAACVGGEGSSTNGVGGKADIVGDDCEPTGCGGQLCADEEIVTTCEAKLGDDCYALASCERQKDGACGFTPNPEFDACLDAALGDKWVTLLPTQCGTNPWEQDPASTGGTALQGELGAIVAYYEATFGISIQEIGLLDPAEPIAVCAACSCPRGDRLVARVSAQDAMALSTMGFAPLEGALATAPVQCGGNPWETLPRASELVKVIAWVNSLDATIAELGFVHTVPEMATCSACSCPRGDLLVVLPEGESSGDTLGSNGFFSL